MKTEPLTSVRVAQLQRRLRSIQEETEHAEKLGFQNRDTVDALNEERRDIVRQLGRPDERRVPPIIDRAALVAWLRGACNNTWPPSEWHKLKAIAEQIEHGDDLWKKGR